MILPSLGVLPGGTYCFTRTQSCSSYSAQVFKMTFVILASSGKMPFFQTLDKGAQAVIFQLFLMQRCRNLSRDNVLFIECISDIDC